MSSLRDPARLPFTWTATGSMHAGSMKSSCGAIRESAVLAEDDERGDHARHPAACGQQEHDEDAAAPPVENGQGRKQDGEDDL